MNPFDTRRVQQTRQAASPQNAWEALVHRYDPLLRGQVHRSLRRAGLHPEPDQVEEWTQEVYCRLLTGGPPRLHQLRSWSEGQVVTYLARVTRGLMLDDWRSRSALKRGKGFRIVSGGRLGEIADRAVDPRASPEEEALRNERRRLLLDRCDALVDSSLGPEERRRALRILRRVFLEGWSSQEVVRAERGRLAPSSVHSMVHRARRRLNAAARGRYHSGP